MIFDRVRENLRGMRKDNIKDIVNVAINQTLNRTIITGGTALLSVIALYFFGGEVLRGFAFTMIVGDHHRHLLERVHRRGHRHLLAARPGRRPDRGVGAARCRRRKTRGDGASAKGRTQRRPARRGCSRR